MLVMIQEGLRVAVPLKDKTLGVVAVEVQLVLQSPGVFRAHQFRAFRGETLKLVKLAIMDFESSDIEVRSLLLPQDVAYLDAPRSGVGLEELLDVTAAPLPSGDALNR